ncbi:MAG: hypothetical protein JWQ40_1226 [Segetibacter sp.]|nr:hypothetical protein [Segetibacter sp.]
MQRIQSVPSLKRRGAFGTACIKGKMSGYKDDKQYKKFEDFLKSSNLLKLNFSKNGNVI